MTSFNLRSERKVNLWFVVTIRKRKEREREREESTISGGRRGGLTRVERYETLMPPLATRAPLITRILFLPLDAVQGTIFHAEDNG